MTIENEDGRGRVVQHICDWARIDDSVVKIWGQIVYCPMCGVKLEINNTERDSGIDERDPNSPSD